MGGPQGREESFPFFFFSLLHKQAVKNTLSSAGRMSLFAFNCTFQQIYQLLLCHLLARGWGVMQSVFWEGGDTQPWGLFDYIHALSKGDVLALE